MKTDEKLKFKHLLLIWLKTAEPPIPVVVLFAKLSVWRELSEQKIKKIMKQNSKKLILKVIFFYENRSISSQTVFVSNLF